MNSGGGRDPRWSNGKMTAALSITVVIIVLVVLVWWLVATFGIPS